MTNGCTSSQFDFFAEQQIRLKASDLLRTGRFSNHEREDLQQGMWIRLLQASSKFDPHRGACRSFVRSVLRNYCRNLIRERRAHKRGPRKLKSLSSLVMDQEGNLVGLGNQLNERHARGLRNVHSRSDQERCELRLDLQSVMAKLTEKERLICQHLKCMTPAEVARELDVPRSTVDSCCKRIRRQFENADLQDYFELVS